MSKTKSPTERQNIESHQILKTKHKEKEMEKQKKKREMREGEGAEALTLARQCPRGVSTGGSSQGLLSRGFRCFTKVLLH